MRLGEIDEVLRVMTRLNEGALGEETLQVFRDEKSRMRGTGERARVVRMFRGRLDLVDNVVVSQAGLRRGGPVLALNDSNGRWQGIARGELRR
jgi:hypothetical protein